MKKIIARTYQKARDVIKNFIQGKIPLLFITGGGYGKTYLFEPYSSDDETTLKPVIRWAGYMTGRFFYDFLLTHPNKLILLDNFFTHDKEQMKIIYALTEQKPFQWTTAKMKNIPPLLIPKNQRLCIIPLGRQLNFKDWNLEIIKNATHLVFEPTQDEVFNCAKTFIDTKLCKYTFNISKKYNREASIFDYIHMENGWNNCPLNVDICIQCLKNVQNIENEKDKINWCHLNDSDSPTMRKIDEYCPYHLEHTINGQGKLMFDKNGFIERTKK